MNFTCNTKKFHNRHHTTLGASGFQRITYEADPEYLFSPQNGEAKFERAQMEKHFPMNYSAFDPGRVSRHGRFGRLLIKANDDGTLLRNNIFQQVCWYFLIKLTVSEFECHTPSK